MVDKIDSKLANALGHARTAIADLRKSNAPDSVIDAVIHAQALKQNLQDAEWKKLIESKPASSSGKVTASKEDFRLEEDRLTNNLLFAINTSTDAEVKTALKQLLDFDKTYQSATGIVQSDRTDWRGMLVISPHPKDYDKLAIYRGGWGDGSKQDRNQYSNGRRVPVAKTTGYALEQALPVKTGKTVADAEKTTADVPNTDASANPDASASVVNPDVQKPTSAPSVDTSAGITTTPHKPKSHKRK